MILDYINIKNLLGAWVKHHPTLFLAHSCKSGDQVHPLCLVPHCSNSPPSAGHGGLFEIFSPSTPSPLQNMACKKHNSTDNVKRQMIWIIHLQPNALPGRLSIPNYNAWK